MSIILSGVEYTYDSHGTMSNLALYDINMNVEKGEKFVILGGNGSGKTTLLNIISGLILPTDGKVYWRGKDISEKDFSMREYRMCAGIITQDFESQFTGRTVEEDVRNGMGSLDRKLECDLRVFKALEKMGIGEDLLDISPGVLSYSQKKRVLLAGVLAKRPELLIIDDFSLGLDEESRSEIWGIIEEMVAENNSTVILATTSKEDAEKMGGHGIVLESGRIKEFF
ncbi:energy-coupling factor ABC transporter ATP-binding protein [Eubacterium xylanophilum]|uniref:energy-coupling factor ABC transporter ATP-binding protein n=1 Tax=Eubacterium xylanophilum TaxID=39497 RepID=UPI0004ACCBBB|nr:energy-coupling factor ABC transporter ATP-binding protein [Eubacterium xylanophilum]